ncbi:MAG: HAD-IIA family hydrolase [Dactylosporangium sp.]|nr:HAD-IIA family hydrolase [Dactylosporangium sp.]NNJ63903.1 HAD-IIA family hydrolase [Dactylosporangium sp.]
MTDTGGLVSGYDLVIFDLDGVLYVGDQPVPRAAAAVARLRDRSCQVIFATNNASRRPGAVAELLGSVGIPASAGEVLTAAAAAAAWLARHHPAGSPILVVGAPALTEEVRQAGLRPVTDAGDAPVAVVQGYGPEVGWASLAEATVAIRAGARWVATNADRTLPSPRGPLPGNGALVAALATALNRQPDTIVGKPDPGLFHQAAGDVSALRPLAVGDRLDTDIEGAHRAGVASLLVLTGVNRPIEVLLAPPTRRPTYVAWTLDGLFDEARPIAETCPAAAEPAAAEARLAGWQVRVEGPALVLDGDGPSIDALRLLCGCWWRTAGDHAGRAPDVRGAGPAAKAALSRLGLA